jgi:diguanylate cyclase (GGDEF)-like protein
MDAPSAIDAKTAAAADAGTTPFHKTRNFRPGMAMRMALGFAALAFTMLAANLATQRSNLAARDHMRQLVVQHEPIVRSTELLANALGDYERAVLAYAEERAARMTAVDEASRNLAGAAAAYAKLNDADEYRQGSMRQLVEDLELYRSLGAALVAQANARRDRIAEYRDQLRRVENRVNEPQERATRFAGGVFTSQALLDLSRTLNLISEKFTATINAPVTPSIRPLTTAEGAFSQALQQHAVNLERTQGVQWLAFLKVEYSSLVSARKLATESVLDLQRRLAEFRDQGAAVSGIVRNQLVEPARRSLNDAQSLASNVALKADEQLAAISLVVLALFIVIAILTVISVTGPVRRLIRATHELATGAVRTRVERGGVQELDVLAGAFNQMAEQLERAEAEVRRHHAQLEARVAERTRELQHLAHHDPLTKLPNRRHLFSRLEGALLRARTNNARLAVLFIDLDNFKTINDSLGHAFGDRVLLAVSDRIRENKHFANSFSARLGGDEFTIVCEDVGPISEVERMCAAVLEEFQQSLSIHGRELRLGVSVGAGIFPDDASEVHALLRAADSALFRAKELGRNRYSLFTPQLLEAASSRFKLEQSLRRAVERGEFDLLYQPQVCFEAMRTQSVEALLRWHQPDGQVVLPGEFMEVAERSGVIMDINDWVLQAAIQTASQWRTSVWPDGCVAVNVSAHQLLSGNFVQRLQSLLSKYDLPPSYLEVELTETVLQTGARTIAALRELRELGVSIALDDFGTGYSSLTSLERLPLTRVKIDRSLLATIDKGARAPAIVRSIVGLSYSLGLQVTAEGVERLSQLGLLLADRGVQVQGFLVARPLHASKVSGFVCSSRQHLEDLLMAAPMPEQDIDSTGARSVRALRTAALRAGRREL